MKIATVILNWNGENMLKQFLPSVLSHITENVIVADNGSKDGSLALLERDFPTVRVIKLNRNYGFAEGYNRALKEVKADYYFLLNSDVELKSNPLPPLLNMLESDEMIAAAMPKIISQLNPDTFEHAGAAGGFIDKYGFPFCRGRIVDNVEKDNGQYDTSCEAFWASGAALFIRSDVYNSLGGFDADFFAHMEEIDLCWRIKNRGYKIMCEPKSVIYHLGGGMLNNESPFKLYLNFRNNLFMLHKNLPIEVMKRRIFERMVIDGMLAIIYLLKGKVSYFKAVLKAHRDYKKSRSTFNKKRGETNNVTKIYEGSILVAFAQGKKQFNDLNF